MFWLILYVNFYIGKEVRRKELFWLFFFLKKKIGHFARTMRTSFKQDLSQNSSAQSPVVK